MGLMLLIILGFLPNLLSARVLDARQTVTCEFSVAASSGDTCTSFAADWGLSEADFQALNPTVACPTTLVAGRSYCVVGSVSSATTTSTSTTTTTTITSSSTSTTTIITPISTIISTFITTTTTSSPYEPTQTGLASNCNGFYLVSSGDTCEGIEAKFGISAQEFDSWNPAINSGCSNLLLGYYVCVSVPGATTTTSISTTTTSSPYSPTQPGLASNCDNFYLVASGDSCIAIESKFGISAQEFDTWNPSIDLTCDNLYLGYYVCVGGPGATTTTSPTPTSTAPSPEMPSIVSDCNKFYLVQSGDGCTAIESAYGITQAQFLSWNPAVDSNCDNLWLGYYVCVGVLWA